MQVIRRYLEDKATNQGYNTKAYCWLGCSQMYVYLYILTTH